jgi:pilus assembly protein Flp/PilA
MVKGCVPIGGTGRADLGGSRVAWLCADYLWWVFPAHGGATMRKARHVNLFVLRTWLQARFARDEEGASMVEYILLVALIALAVIAAITFLRDQENTKFNQAGSALSSAGS